MVTTEALFFAGFAPFFSTSLLSVMENCMDPFMPHKEPMEKLCVILLLFSMGQRCHLIVFLIPQLYSHGMKSSASCQHLFMKLVLPSDTTVPGVPFNEKLCPYLVLMQKKLTVSIIMSSPKNNNNNNNKGLGQGRD